MEDLWWEKPLWLRRPVLDLLLGRGGKASSSGKRHRKRVENKQPRRGDPFGQGLAKWWLPIPRNAWEELERPEVYDESSWDGKRFASVYGVPKKIFDELVQEAARHEHLEGKREHGDGRRGPISKPLELKVAAVLEICQANLLFKTAERLYKISTSVLDNFFRDFMRAQVEHEYAKHVYVPETPTQVEAILSKHAMLGMPGCITMHDGVKWKWKACPFADHYAHVGKEGEPTKLFMVGGDATKIIHHVSGSHPGARNDLTAARYDEYYLLSLRHRTRYADHTFELYTGNGDERVKHSGLWSLTDNGFHKWRVTQFPAKISSDEWVKRWSKRGESIRKPGTECIYGILKKRFRMLADGCHFKETELVDDTFRFLCSLHNQLQRHYGLDTIGDDASDWIAANTDRDLVRITRDEKETGRVPFLVSDALVGNEVEAEMEPSWAGFRTLLVTHFRVQWQKKRVMWLKTAAECRPGYRTNPAIRRKADGQEEELDE